MKKKRIIIAITGASGASLGLKFIKYLPKEYEKFVIISENAKIVLKKEQNITYLNNFDISAPTASGSFKCDKMAIIPCSANSLAKISLGIADNLITRTASVMIKEQRKILIAPREMPFSPIILENMLKLSRLGVIISPPILGYYSTPKNIKELEKFIIGKWFDSLGIKNSLFKRWK